MGGEGSQLDGDSVVGRKLTILLTDWGGGGAASGEVKQRRQEAGSREE